MKSDDLNIPENKWIDVQSLRLLIDGLFDFELSGEFPLRTIYLKFPPSYTSIPNYHHFFEICYVYDGDGVFFLEEKEYSVSKGDVFIVSASKFHHMKSGTKGVLKTICLTFLPEVIYRSGTHEADYVFLLPFYYDHEKIGHVVSKDDPLSRPIVGFFMKMVSEMEHNSTFSEQILKVNLYNLLLQILIYNENIFSSHNIVLKDQYHLNRLKKVLDYIHKNYHEHINLDEIADIAKLSKTYLCKYFKRIIGRSVAEYIIRCRLNETKRLLIYTDLPVSQIAYDSGFNSHSYFNRAFIKIFHQSPTVFRDSHRS